jgi:hypothetical protein
MAVEDIRQAVRVITEKAGDIGMYKDELEKARDLCEKYGDERDRLFDEMVSLLRQPDTSSLRDNWKTRCDKGKDLLERLDREMPQSPTGQGLNGVGAGDFAQGEKKIWEQNAKADIAFVADVINKIYMADLELIKKCNDDLKTVRDGDKAVQALVEENLGGIKNDVLDIVKTVAQKAGEKELTSWMKGGSAKDYFKKWYSYLFKRMEDNLKAAKQKRLLKQILLDNIELVGKTKDQLSEEWIAAMYKKGEEFSRSLKSLGSGVFIASDWGKFGEDCIKELAERRDRAIEQSKKLFGELFPTLTEETNRSYAALTDDPSKLTAWKSEMDDNFKSIDDLLKKEDELINAIAEGAFKKAARETFDEVRLTVTAGVKLLFSSTKDAEDEMKR